MLTFLILLSFSLSTEQRPAKLTTQLTHFYHRSAELTESCAHLLHKPSRSYSVSLSACPLRRDFSSELTDFFFALLLVWLLLFFCL